MELKVTNHSYYSSGSNYYVGNYNGENFGRCDYETWQDFKDEWFFSDGTIDHDYNHCFRFDIKPKRDKETDEEIEGKFELWLFFILQRKGIYRPVYVENIVEEDMEEVESYLKKCWKYLKGQWEEISGGVK